MKKTILSPEDIKDIIQLYTNKIISSTHVLAKNFKTTHKNISHILKEKDITINNKYKGPQVQIKGKNAQGDQVAPGGVLIKGGQ